MRTTMHNNHQWQQKHAFSSEAPVASTDTHHGHSNIIAIGEGVEKADYGNIEESRQSQSSNISTSNNTFFGRATDRPISAPPPMSLDLGGNSLLRNFGNGSVDGIERNRGGNPHQGHQESSWSAASSADRRILAGRNSLTDNDGGGSYNSLGSLDQPHRTMYDFGNDPTINNSSSLTDMMGSRAPPGLVVGVSSNDHGSNRVRISSLDSSSSYDHDAVGMAIPRPASTGLIGHSQKHQQHQHQIYQQGRSEVRSVKSSPGFDLGLIQFDGINGGGESGSVGGSGGGSTGGAVKHKSVMDWIQEDFPKTSSPVYSDNLYPNGTHNAQYYDSSSMGFDAKLKASQGVTASYDAHAQPYEHTSLSHGTMSQTPVRNNLQSMHHQETTTMRHMPHNYKQQQHNNDHVSKQPAHPSLIPMANNAHHHPHHVLPLSNYDPQQQAIYYDDHSRESQGEEERPGFSTPSHPPHVIQTTASTISINGPPHHHPPPPPPPHAVYLNSVPSYGGYTTVYHHGPPPHPHHHPHHPPPHHPYTTLSNPPSIMHATAQTTPAAAVDHNMIHHTTPTSTPTPLSPEYISLPTNGTYVYWQPPAHPISHHPHHHHPQTVPVVGSNGHPTGISVSNGPPLPLTDSMNKRQQHARKGNVRNVGAGSKNPGRKTSGPRGPKRVAGGVGVDKDSVDYVSTLLDDFHLGKSRSWTTHDVKGHIVAFCQDQNGSRFIQQRLEIATDSERHLVLSEVLPSVRQLRNDVFGNYVVQKLFDYGNNEIKSELKATLEGEVLQLSTQMYGCRVVQKALECVEEEDLLSLLKEFRGHIITCIHDQNGNHVIQKCIEVINIRLKMMRANAGYEGVPCDNNDYCDTGNTKERSAVFQNEMESIVNCVLTNAASLSCHPYGCRVLQRILEHCTDDLKTEALDTIRTSHRVLLDDQYGNYVIQHVLQFGRDDDRDSILSIVVENGLLMLSRQKFASNVVEKLLKYGNGRTRNTIVREMLKLVEGKDTSAGSGDGPASGRNNSSSVVLLMVRDAYANYVVQTTLDVVPEGEEKRLLLEELNRNSFLLRNYTFAKHIVTKLGSADAGGV